MQLRRFIGDTTPAALGQVREALGGDAIILSNRRVGDRVEIIATRELDQASLSEAPLTEAVRSAATPAAVDARIGAGYTGAADDARGSRPVEFARIAESVQATAAYAGNAAAAMREYAPPSASSADEGVKVDLRSIPGMEVLDDEPTEPLAGNGTGEDKDIASLSRDLASVEVPGGGIELSSFEIREQATDSAPHHDTGPASRRTTDGSAVSGARADATLDRFEALLARHADRLDERFRQLEVRLWATVEPERSAHLKRLMQMGLGAELAVRLSERVSPDAPPDQAIRESLSVLKSSLTIGVDRSLDEPGVTVLSGPGGGGKTTMLMKLAAQQRRLTGPQSIVMITTDTRRVGAFEALQAFGRLLGVPAVHARNASELSGLIDAFSHKQLVLIDHAMCEESDRGLLPGLPARLDGERGIRKLMVLPATLQASAGDAVVARYRDSVDACILTQLDRCSRLGELFNALIRHHLPIAYWSDGAQVQNELQRADASVLVATAVAMGKRVPATADDRFLMSMVQPTCRLDRHAEAQGR